jgi:hypothetical protein
MEYKYIYRYIYIYIYLLIRYSRACYSYQDFLDRGLLLTRKLLNQSFLLVKLKVLCSPPRLGWPLWNFCVTNDNGHVPLVINTSRSFPHSWHHRFVTRLSRQVSLVEQELPTLPEQSSSPPPPGFSGVRVTRSLVLYVCFLDRCLSFCTFSLAIVLSVLRCTDSDYSLWQPQTLLTLVDLIWFLVF